jgi:anti-sigma factor RsiW
MDSETPFAGHGPGPGDDAPYEWLDEWLCEYVDGTMDPSLEAVFEQYVEANPELKAHVERLQETRDLLCECGLSREVPTDVEAEICTEVECDMLQSSAPLSEFVRDHSMAALGVVSSVAVALVVGFLVGATMVETEPAGSSPSVATPAANAPLERVQATSPGSDVPLLRPPSPSSTADSARAAPDLTTLGLP